MAHPWPAGCTTGIGSLPLAEPDEAVRLVLGEVPDLPYLPELPGRGIGADMIGRTAALLADLAVEWQPHGWTIASRAGREERRARDYLRHDVDALVDQAQGVAVVKVQVCGPMTLGAQLELPNLHKVLTDSGAFRDLVGSLAEGTRRHLADLRRQLPGTEIVLQVDESGIAAVLAGHVSTPSGYGTVRALERSIAEPALAAVLGAATEGHRVVHCCAPDVPFELLRGAGANAVSLDASLLRNQHLDAIGELIDNGGSIWLGIVPGTDADLVIKPLRDQILGLWRRLGFSPEMLSEAVVPTPSCGLAGASPDYVRAAMSVLRDLGHSLLDGAE